MRQMENIIGKIFNRFTVLRYDIDKSNKTKQNFWICECACNNIRSVLGDSLRCGSSKSCGCLRHDAIIESNIIHNTTHGLTKHPLYSIWKAMVARCYNTKNNRYYAYGAKGIIVCDEWKTSPTSFIQYVMSLLNYGKKGYSLDRINTQGHYEPNNVRWATAQQQHRNTTKNRLIMYRGKVQSVAAWIEELGLVASTVRTRIDRHGPNPAIIFNPAKMPRASK